MSNFVVKAPRDYTDEELIDLLPKLSTAGVIGGNGSTTFFFYQDIREEALRRMGGKK